jgi:hypothetical protein
MQFQVPQFIESEDKIVGPLSLRQFAYVAAGGAVSAFLYFFVQTWLWAFASLIIFAITIALAFVKIEGRPFVSVMISAFHFYWKPQTYVWQPEHPTIAPHKEVKKAAESSGLEEILESAAKRTQHIVSSALPRSQPVIEKPAEKPLTRETIQTSNALHKSWEDVQTGAPLSRKTSDKQFLEKKMSERYQIFQRIAGDRQAAKRIDYR